VATGGLWEGARASVRAACALGLAGGLLGACGGRVLIADAAVEDATPGVLVAAGADDPFIAADDEGGAYVAYSLRGAGCSGNQLFVQHVPGPASACGSRTASW